MEGRLGRGLDARPQPDILQRFEDAVAAIQDSDSFRRWLDVSSRFHEYSLGNQLLIAMQRPDASYVAGFHTWLTLGRHVRKGEKGTTAVYADSFVPKKEQEAASQSEGEPRRVAFLKRFTLFNIAQCDGAPCRREKGVVRNDLGQPKLTYARQSYRTPKGLRDHSMTGARPKSAKPSQRRRVRARLVWLRLDCLNPNPGDLSADDRTPMAQVRFPSKARSDHRRCTHSVCSAPTPVRGLRMSWEPKRVTSPSPRKHGMAYSRSDGPVWPQSRNSTQTPDVMVGTDAEQSVYGRRKKRVSAKAAPFGGSPTA